MACAKGSSPPPSITLCIRTFGKENQPPKGRIRFSKTAKEDAVSDYSKEVLYDIMEKAEETDIVITSTARSPENQVEIMCENIKQYGIKHQKGLYLDNGDKVIDQYPDKSAMIKKIYELGSSNVSRHLADPSKLNVFDIAPSSIQNRSAFENAVKSNLNVSKFLYPPQDKAYHIEILQP